MIDLNTDGYWCKSCESYRVRSLGAECPVCAPDVPKPRFGTPARLALDVRTVATASGEVET